MRILVLQHVESEGPGTISDWAKARGHELNTLGYFRKDSTPGINDFDAVIILGGPMSIYDEAEFPWLREEKDFIRQAIEAEKMLLGICLGSQLLADSLGAKVFPNDEKEIGWFPIRIAERGKLFDSTGELMTFHWHGDTFEQPPSAKVLASSSATKIQVFQQGENILGLQCHFEINPELGEAMIACGESELADKGKYVQSAAEIRDGFGRHQAAVKDGLFSVLDKFFDKI